MKRPLAFLLGLLTCGLLAQGQTNVLVLDGRTGYIELPPKMFEGLHEATVEGWMKWRSFGHWYRFWDYGRPNDTLHVTEGNYSSELILFLLPQRGATDGVHARNTLEPGQWYHVAAVTGPDGMKVYLDGQLAGTASVTNSFADVTPGGKARLGRDCWSENDFTPGE